MSARPKYAIINDTDAPQPNMVVQWVEGIGYCYMDRRQGKSDFDGMRGDEATDIRSFGFSYAEDTDGFARFYRNALEPTATYQDGESRPWQSQHQNFEWRIIRVRGKRIVAQRVSNAP